MFKPTATESLVAIIVWAAAGTAVFFHAERNQIKHPSAWASAVFFFSIFGFIFYVRQVRRTRRARGEMV